MYLVPVVTDGISENGAGAVEASGRYGAADLGESLEFLARVLVPECKCAIGSCSRKRAMNGVPVDAIDRVDGCLVTRIGSALAMALEGKVERRVLVLDILNSDASFDTADSVSRASREAGHCSGLPFERTG